MKIRNLLLINLLLCACGARAQPTQSIPDPEPVPDSVVWNADPELAPLLRRGQLTEIETAAAERVAQYVGVNTFIERLGLIAEDTTNPWVVRANALKLLGDYPAVSELLAFGNALRAREERVRMTAVSAMRQYLLATPQSALRILELALDDPSPRVQARALEILSDRDVDILRRYYRRSSNAELRGVAENLIRTAEERGARLVMPKDSLGILGRVTTGNVVISFRPAQQWPNWDAAVGELRVQLPTKQPTLVSSNVEVAGGVVPAFIPPDSAVLIYESNREIRVRSLKDNSDRKLADGIAPRIFPFSNDLIFFREVGDRKPLTAHGTPLRYQIVRMPLSGGTGTVLGELSVNAQNDVKGSYSPVRWSRVREIEGRFYLVGDSFKDFELPSPF
jgi:hypothetical protein